MYINLKMAERNVDIRHVTGIKVAQWDAGEGCLQELNIYNMIVLIDRIRSIGWMLSLGFANTITLYQHPI